MPKGKRGISPEVSVGYQIRATHRSFDRLLQRYIGKHKIKNGFWYILRVLWEQEGMSQRELSEMVYLREPSTVTMLNLMQKAGLVKRAKDPDDRRKSKVYLTKTAKSLEAELLPYVKIINDRAAVGIPKKDLATFMRVVNALRININDELKNG